MKGGAKPRGNTKLGAQGFTILETMIVLAVSAALLAAAMVMLDGRQGRTEFSQAIQQVSAQLQQDMNDVSNGYYPNNDSVNCKDSGGPILSKASTERGTNQDCVYLGKVLQFTVGDRNDMYNVYTVTGLRSGEDSLPDAKARLIAKATGEESSSIPDDVYDSRVLPYGLSVSAMYYGNNPAASHIGTVGFISHLGPNAHTGQVDVVAIPATSLGMQKGDAVRNVNIQLRKNPPTVVTNPVDGVHICLVSGGSNQSALLTIGGEGQQSTTSLDVKEGTSC